MSRVIIFIILIGASEGTSQCPNKTELDACLARIAPHMPKAGLPANAKQLNKMCKAFKGGMECVDGYTRRCLTKVQREGLEIHLKGARSILAFLCDDPVFQREYLSHSVCIKEVQEDWDRCQSTFKYLVNEQHLRNDVNKTQRTQNICCVRAGFLQCVYSMSYLKCGKSQAIFLKKLTATLAYTDVHQHSCRNLTRKACSSATSTNALYFHIIPSVLLFLIFSRA